MEPILNLNKVKVVTKGMHLWIQRVQTIREDWVENVNGKDFKFS